MHEDRRRYPRELITRPLYVGLNSPSSGGIVNDISEKGMGIDLVVGPKPGSGDILLSLEFPGADKSFEAKAKVAWSKNSNKFGLEFVDLTAASRLQINVLMGKSSPGAKFSQHDSSQAKIREAEQPRRMQTKLVTPTEREFSEDQFVEEEFSEEEELLEELPAEESVEEQTTKQTRSAALKAPLRTQSQQPSLSVARKLNHPVTASKSAIDLEQRQQIVAKMKKWLETNNVAADSKPTVPTGIPRQVEVPLEQGLLLPTKRSTESPIKSETRSPEKKEIKTEATKTEIAKTEAAKTEAAKPNATNPVATKPTAGRLIIPNLVVPSEKKEFQPDVPKGIVDKKPERPVPEPQQSDVVADALRSSFAQVAPKPASVELTKRNSEQASLDREILNKWISAAVAVLVLTLGLVAARWIYSSPTFDKITSTLAMRGIMQGAAKAPETKEVVRPDGLKASGKLPSRSKSEIRKSKSLGNPKMGPSSKHAALEDPRSELMNRQNARGVISQMGSIVTLPSRHVAQAPQISGLQSMADSQSATRSGRVVLQRTAETPEKMILPEYPAEALQKNEQGRITLNATISKDGTLQNVRLVGEPSILSDAALRAVKTWRYHPHIENEIPIDAETQITIDFTK
jgi:TonB family protein